MAWCAGFFSFLFSGMIVDRGFLFVCTCDNQMCASVDATFNFCHNEATNFGRSMYHKMLVLMGMQNLKVFELRNGCWPRPKSWNPIWQPTRNLKLNMTRMGAIVALQDWRTSCRVRKRKDTARHWFNWTTCATLQAKPSNCSVLILWLHESWWDRVVGLTRTRLLML